jgi:hypothetical protein
MGELGRGTRERERKREREREMAAINGGFNEERERIGLGIFCGGFGVNFQCNLTFDVAGPHRLSLFNLNHGLNSRLS